ncbi:MAG: acyl--CoA ligase [Lachnospiraceae bacterium]|nr:acyl--CoA ligase [Lachnospiraceae bacterium]
MNTIEQKNYEKVSARVRSGKITAQKSWKMIRELNSFSDERLDKAALITGKRTFTYRQLFRQWERYAEAFSGLGITWRKHSRVGVVSTPSAESVFTFYGLNMTGASVSMIHMLDVLESSRFDIMIRKEGLTDLIFSDIAVNPALVRRIAENKESLGLRNIIISQNTVAGPFAPPELKLHSRMIHRQLKTIPGVLFMDDLLEEYEAHPIVYGRSASAEDALIIHTSGTTSGIHKPVPFSDQAFNESVSRLLTDERFRFMEGTAVSFLGMELAASYAVMDMMHLPLSFGGAIVTIPMGIFNPLMGKAIPHYGVNIMFGSPGMIEDWIRVPEKPDLSSLAFIFLGGVYVSLDEKRRLDNYLAECGCKVRTTIGYGLTEAGAAVIISDAERTDDAIGFPLQGVKVLICDEEDGKFYTPEDGPHTGTLFLSTPSLSSGRIDDEVFFTLDEIDGESFLNTYDKVTVYEDGSLCCIGRTDKYFVNNEGVRFDAGIVETAVAAQPGIRACALAPGFDKLLHDTIPVLYVSTTVAGRGAAGVVRQALCNAFIKENRIQETNLPGQCVITEKIPFTETGKVDVHKILKAGINGKRFTVTPVRIRGKLTDVTLIPAPDSVQEKIGLWTGLPEELEMNADVLKTAFTPAFERAKSGKNRAFAPPVPPGKSGEQGFRNFDPRRKHLQFTIMLLQHSLEFCRRLQGSIAPEPEDDDTFS